MLKEVELGSEAIVFFKESLSQGDSFAWHLLRLPLENGKVISYLPSVLDFDVSQTLGLSISLRTGVEMKRSEAESRISDYIFAYLEERDTRYAIFETYARVGDISPSLERLPLFSYNSEVYYFLSSKDCSPERVLEVLRSARYYPFICGLTSLPENSLHIRPNQDLTATNVLEQLAARTAHIVVGAYDEEGYLIWSRNRLLENVL